MKTKHTPGPWIYWDTGNGIGICPETVTKELIPNLAAFQNEIVRLKYDEERWETVKANVRLIAAAPELLQALKDAQSRLCEHCPQYIDSQAEQVGDHTDECLAAMEAIAKAEGKI